jgi:hypothetical protein
MSTQLAINDFDSAINAVSSIEKLAIIMLKNPHYKILGEAGVYAILFAAKATNVDPFHALNGGFNYIKGKVAMSTELQVAKIRGAGHSVWKDDTSTATHIILHGKRADNGDIWTSEFGMKDATNAGLMNQDTYKKYPTTMFYNRAMSLLARQLFSDVIKGMAYTPDELEEIASSKNKERKIVPLDSIPVENVEVVHVEELKKLEEIKPKPAKKESIDKLLKMIEQCGDEYQKNFWEILSNNGIDDVYQMPVISFNGLVIATKEHIAVNHITLVQEVVPF